MTDHDYAAEYQTKCQRGSNWQLWGVYYLLKALQEIASAIERKCNG